MANKIDSIREYINGMAPDLKAFSIRQLIDENSDECDFTKMFGLVGIDAPERSTGKQPIANMLLSIFHFSFWADSLCGAYGRFATCQNGLIIGCILIILIFGLRNEIYNFNGL